MVKLMVTLIEIDIDINKNLQECGQAAERSSALLCQCCLSGISPFALTVQNAPKHLQTEQGRSNLISRYFQREVEEGLGSSPFSSSPFSYNSWERRSSLSGGSRERQVMVNSRYRFVDDNGDESFGNTSPSVPGSVVAH